ncbi:MAG: cadherin repeat domain-containing protein, partial [Pirellulales bacterium]|nr:cadherin repeat domain-containing protein [Pirellulales bacterium]
ETDSIGATIGTLSTTDDDSGDTHTYSLVAGEGDSDNARFSISGDQLLTGASLDFDTQESYSIRVKSTDADGLSVEQVLTISVTNVNEGATEITLTPSHVADEQPTGTTVGTLGSDDPDADDVLTFTLVSGTGDTDNDQFSISGNQLVTSFDADQATKSSYSIRVRVVDDGGLSAEQTLTVTVTDTNVAPTAIELLDSSVAEDAEPGTAVGTLSTTDANSSDLHTYELVAGQGDADNGLFAIEGDQLLVDGTLDFETQETYTVRIRSTDSFGLSVEQSVTINATDANDAPTEIMLSDDSISENSPAGTTIGMLSTTDPDAGDLHTYQLVEGDGDADNALFTISGDALLAVTSFNFEARDSYSIRVRSTDSGGLSVEQMLTIKVDDVNESPANINLSSTTVADGQTSGTVVGTLDADDPDASDTLTFTLVTGEGDDDNASFNISGDQLTTTFDADQATKSSYTIRVRAEDGGGLTTERSLTITVTEANAAPTAILLSESSIEENAAVGSAIGMFTSTDSNTNDTHTYELVNGDGDADNALFTIDGDSLRTAQTLDFETQSEFTVRVRSTDTFGLSVEQSFTITAINVNDAPASVSLDDNEVAENAAIGTSVGTLSTTDDDSADTFTYSLVTGEGDDDNAMFSISGDELLTAASLDFETQSSFSVRVRSTDSGGLFVERTLNIVATDVNEGATTLTLSSDHVADGQPSGTAVGKLGNNDPDAGDTFTYSLVAGDGDDDNGSFSISDDQLLTSFDADQATKSSYSVRVRVADASNLSTEQVFTITITETNVA